MVHLFHRHKLNHFFGNGIWAVFALKFRFDRPKCNPTTQQDCVFVCLVMRQSNATKLDAPVHCIVTDDMADAKSKKGVVW